MTWAGLKNQTRKCSLSMYKGLSSGRRPTWNACFCLLSCSQSNWELPQLGSIMLATALWPKWGHFYSWYFDNKADIVHVILPAVSLQRQNFNTDLSIRKHAGPPLSHFPRIATNSFHGFQRTFLCSHVWHGIEITIFFVLDYKKTLYFFYMKMMSWDAICNSCTPTHWQGRLSSCQWQLKELVLENTQHKEKGLDKRPGHPCFINHDLSILLKTSIFHSFPLPK